MFEIKESRAYYIVLFSILVLAFSLRIFILDIRPFHSDEGVNFIFMDNLIKNDKYMYDPENYHGPILYYLTLIPLSLWGLDTSLLPERLIQNGDYAYRLWPVILGFGLVVFLIPLKRWLKWSGLLSCMTIAAISPTAVYYSRDNIHEMYLMFFTLATFVCGYLFFTTMKSRYIYLTAVFLALMFTAKETTMVTLVVWFLSAIGASIFTTKPFSGIFRRTLDSLKGSFVYFRKPLFILFFATSLITLFLIFFSKSFKGSELKWYVAIPFKGVLFMTVFLVFIMFFKGMRGKFYKFLIGWVIFYIVLSLFFTSFFSHGDGVGKFFKAFEMWTHQGTVGSKHTKSFDYYFKLLYRFEKPSLFFGILGILYAFWKRKPLELFVAFFGIGSFLAFSLIPYKTPWCVQNLLLPLIILSGIFIRALFELTPSFVLRCVYVPVILVFLFNSLKVSADVNYLSYDNDSYELVYVQTLRSAKKMVTRIDELCNVKFDGRETKILMTSSENLPLNWYFRKHTTFWHQRIVPNLDNYPIIIAKRDQERELESKFKKNYQKEHYSLRPGVALTLYYQGEDRVRVVPEKYKLSKTDSLKGREKLLLPGLHGKVFQHTFFAGKKLGERVDKKIDFRYDTEPEKPYPAPFSIVWNGYVYAPESGDYLFSSISDDGSFISIDGNLIVDNGGEHGEIRRAREVYLEKGYHEIEVKYFDLMGGAIMRLYWKQPNQFGERAITGDNLFHLD